MSRAVNFVKFFVAQIMLFGGIPFLLYGGLYSVFSTRVHLILPSLLFYYFAIRRTTPPLGYHVPVVQRLNRALAQPLYDSTGGKVYLWDEALDPNRQYMFACVPHGVVIQYWSLVTQHLPLKMPPIPLAARFLFQLPLVREYYMTSMLEGSPHNLTKIFEHGRSCILIPGGVTEMILTTRPGDFVRVYCKNKGFVKRALVHGVPIVGIFAFGENNIWEQKQPPEFIAQWFRRNCGGFYPMIPWGVGPFLPYPARVVHCIGPAVEMPQIEDPTPEEIAFHHKRFYKSIADLVEKRKDEAGYPNIRVQFIGLEELNIGGGRAVGRKSAL